MVYVSAYEFEERVSSMTNLELPLLQALVGDQGIKEKVAVRKMWLLL